MKADLSKLIAGARALVPAALAGAKTELEGAAAGVTHDMRNDPAHGDATGASHASYNARVVGLGEDGSALLAVARAAAEAYNPDHVAPPSPLTIAGELGVIIDDPMEYGPDRETTDAGAKAVEGPTIASSGDRFTRAVARGSKRVLK